MRLLCTVATAIIILILTACSSACDAPAPITDGITCLASLQSEGENPITLQVSRKGVEYVAQFVQGGTQGLTVEISPKGCLLSFDGIQNQIDPKLISNSLPMLVYTALTHRYSAEEYNGECYSCSDECGSFSVWVDDGGVISAMKFNDFNYTLTFDYKI